MLLGFSEVQHQLSHDPCMCNACPNPFVGFQTVATRFWPRFHHGIASSAECSAVKLIHHSSQRGQSLHHFSDDNEG